MLAKMFEQHAFVLLGSKSVSEEYSYDLQQHTSFYQALPPDLAFGKFGAKPHSGAFVFTN